MQPAMNNPYSAASGSGTARPPQPGRTPLQPAALRPPSLDGAAHHPGDFRLGSSYPGPGTVPPPPTWTADGGFQSHMYAPMGAVGAYDQASGVASFRPPPIQTPSPSKQYYANGSTPVSATAPTGPGAVPHPAVPQAANTQQPYVSRLDLGYMSLPVWNDTERREEDRNGHSSADGARRASPPQAVRNGIPPTSSTSQDPPPRPPVNPEPEEDKAQIDDEKVDHRKRKRNRTIRSCVPCHNHKRKCDRKRPCGRCTALGLTGSCVYEVDEARDPNDPDVIETDRLRRRIAELEQVVRELRQRHPGRGAAAATAAVIQAPPAVPVTDAEKRRVIVDRYARFKIGEAVATVGNGTEGMSPDSNSAASGRQPQYAEPYSAKALPGEEMVSDMQGRKTFLGTPAGKHMFRRLREVVHGKGNRNGGQDEIMSVPEDLAFTGWFASTRKTYPFTTIWSHDTFIDEIVDLLPSREDAELLLGAFVDEITVLFQAWHLPTLQAEYRHFFTLSPPEKRKQPLGSLALFIMICSAGCMVRASGNEIMGDDHVPASRGNDNKDLTSSRLQSELYLSAAYQALRLCSFLSTPTIYTIQTQILINVYLLHSERAADSWALTGSLVRQCIAMGLQVDPAVLDSRISVREAEVRRRVWWTVAGLEALLCVSFGRPTCINYYTCNLPQDIPDELLSDEPGSAILEPTSNVLQQKTTEESYHAAYFQITIPSFDLLNRTFSVSPVAARNSYMGWFTPAASEDPPVNPPTTHGNMYDDAIRLGRNIFEWYSHVPEGIRFDPNDTTLNYLKTRTRREINQTLALAVKTFILVLILHRPYLRADPSAYPESSNLCSRASHIILQAYRTMVRTKSSIVWSWWTMSYRAFHAGTVCAFLAIREPNTELAERCLADLRGAITILEDRTSNWMVSHPVQSDLCGGLVRLEKLATAATQQNSPRMHDLGTQNNTSGTPADASLLPGMNSVPGLNSDVLDPMGFLPSRMSSFDGTSHPTSGNSNGHGCLSGAPSNDPRCPSSAPFLQPWAIPHLDSLHSTYGLEAQLPPMTSNGKDDAQDLVQIWASMFNIKMDPAEMDMNQGISPLVPPPP